jgi:hypothetical protein
MIKNKIMKQIRKKMRNAAACKTILLTQKKLKKKKMNTNMKIWTMNIYMRTMKKQKIRIFLMKKILNRRNTMV